MAKKPVRKGFLPLGKQLFWKTTENIEGTIWDTQIASLIAQDLGIKPPGAAGGKEEEAERKREGKKRATRKKSALEEIDELLGLKKPTPREKAVSFKDGSDAGSAGRRRASSADSGEREEGVSDSDNALGSSKTSPFNAKRSFKRAATLVRASKLDLSGGFAKELKNKYGIQVKKKAEDAKKRLEEENEEDEKKKEEKKKQMQTFVSRDRNLQLSILLSRLPPKPQILVLWNIGFILGEIWTCRRGHSSR